MKLEILVSTMRRNDRSLPDQMNLRTDALIVNQCDRFEYAEQLREGGLVRWYSLPERGVGLSRNTALMRARGEIVLFADDDVVYFDDYEKTVLAAFEAHPEAGVITFNLASQNPDRPEYMDERDHRLHWYNCLRYGASRIAARREVLLNHNITYSLLFGGGAKYQAGEDNLFLTQCLQSGIVCRASAAQIGTVKQEESTWFKGFNERYYEDRGSLFAAMYGRRAKLMSLLMELKSARRGGEVPLSRRIKLARKGIRSYRSVG